MWFQIGPVEHVLQPILQAVIHDGYPSQLASKMFRGGANVNANTFVNIITMPHSTGCKKYMTHSYEALCGPPDPGLCDESGV